MRPSSRMSSTSGRSLSRWSCAGRCAGRCAARARAGRAVASLPALAAARARVRVFIEASSWPPPADTCGERSHASIGHPSRKSCFKVTQPRPAAPSRIVIATRESRLALWQAQHVQSLLAARGHEVALLGMTTRGDRILDRSLSKVGGKGLFVKELEAALEDGRADIAVHSLKDVPMELPDGFALACVLEREDARDAFVSARYAALAELPAGAVPFTTDGFDQIHPSASKGADHFG